MGVLKAALHIFSLLRLWDFSSVTGAERSPRHISCERTQRFQSAGRHVMTGQALQWTQSRYC